MLICLCVQSWFHSYSLSNCQTFAPQSLLVPSLLHLAPSTIYLPLRSRSISVWTSNAPSSGKGSYEPPRFLHLSLQTRRRLRPRRLYSFVFIRLTSRIILPVALINISVSTMKNPSGLNPFIFRSRLECCSVYASPPSFPLEVKCLQTVWRRLRLLWQDSPCKIGVTLSWRTISCFHGVKTKCGFYQTLELTMVWFDPVIEIFHRSMENIRWTFPIFR